MIKSFELSYFSELHLVEHETKFTASRVNPMGRNFQENFPMGGCSWTIRLPVWRRERAAPDKGVEDALHVVSELGLRHGVRAVRAEDGGQVDVGVGHVSGVARPALCHHVRVHVGHEVALDRKSIGQICRPSVSVRRQIKNATRGFKAYKY